MCSGSRRNLETIKKNLRVLYIELAQARETLRLKDVQYAKQIMQDYRASTTEERAIEAFNSDRKFTITK